MCTLMERPDDISNIWLTAPVQVLVRRRLRELAAVLLHEVMLVGLVLGLNIADPKDTGSNCHTVSTERSHTT